jgi:S-adenosylmethionine decarboxylase
VILHTRFVAAGLMDAWNISRPEEERTESSMIGQHLLADLYDVASDRLVDAGLLADCLDEAARRGGMKPIGPPVLHRFEGGGLTGYLLLSESHIAFHTYPEHRYIALDIFSCGGGDSKAALSVFLAALEPGRERITTAPRGAEIPQRD